MNPTSPATLRAAKSALLAVTLTTVLLVATPGMFTSASAQTTYVEAWGWNGEGECDVPAGLTDASAVSAGGDCSLALKSNGTVVAWGNNDIGQCNVPAGLNNAIAISAGMQRFGLALKSDGTVVGWGNNGQGQINIPAGLSNVIAIAAGDAHSLALKSDGTVVAWGGSSCGQNINPPAGLSNVVAISAFQNSLALKSDGSLVQWDCNSPSIPGGLPPFSAIATRQHTLALSSGGILSAWGLDDYGAATVPGGISNVTAIAVGNVHNLVLKNDGTVAAWGFNRDGQGSVPPGLSAVSAISAGANHNLAITTIPLIKIVAQPQSVTTNAGTTARFSVSATSAVPFNYRWQKNGTNIASATNATLTLVNVQSADAGSYTVILSHTTLSITSSVASLALVPLPLPTIVSQPKNQILPLGSAAGFSVTATSSLTIGYQWQLNGTNLSGQTASNLVIASIAPGDAGNYRVIVSNTSGSVTSIVANLSFQQSPYVTFTPATVISVGGPAVPAGLDDVVAIAAGYGQQLAVRSNGTVVSWGTADEPIGAPPSNLSNVVAVASGGIHNIALKSDGTVVGWGTKGTPPAGLSGVVAIASGHDNSIALKSDGTAVIWGGIVNFPPPAFSNYVGVAVANVFNTGVRSDGTVPANPKILGFNGFSNTVAIAGSGFDSFTMLRNDGTVTGFHQTIPVGLSSVISISPGLALKSDGSVVALGGSIPAGLTNVLAVAGSPGNGLVLTRWPAILQPPLSQAVDASTTTTFVVGAAGAPPLTYQWRFNGATLSGATTSSLVISNTQLSDAGIYDVVVGNGAGAFPSLPATLTVNGFPAITKSPAAATLYVGMRIDLATAATGAQPLSYQWRRNGGNIGGATAATLSLNNVQLTDGGTYTVMVTNSFGAVTSAPGTLTVIASAFKISTPGTVVGLGGAAVPSDLTNAIAIASGYGQSLAVRLDGTVVAWGQGLNPLGPPPAGLSNVVAVASGGPLNAALKSDGTVVSWGASSTLPSGLFGVVAIAAGHDSCVALKGDGTTLTWGPIKQFPPSSAYSNYVGVTIVDNFGMGVLSDGTVLPNINIQGSLDGPHYFPGATNITAVAGSAYNSLALLRGDGTVAVFNLPTPAGLSNVVAISGGLALKSDGTVVGLNAEAPPGLTNVTAVSGWVGRGLVITTNPPPPVLGGESSDGNFTLTTPLSVPGYILMSSDSPAGPFTEVTGYTNAVTDPNGYTVPMSETKKYYRLRKR